MFFKCSTVYQFTQGKSFDLSGILHTEITSWLLKFERKLAIFTSIQAELLGQAELLM